MVLLVMVPEIGATTFTFVPEPVVIAEPPPSNVTLSGVGIVTAIVRLADRSPPPDKLPEVLMVRLVGGAPTCAAVVECGFDTLDVCEVNAVFTVEAEPAESKSVDAWVAALRSPRLLRAVATFARSLKLWAAFSAVGSPDDWSVVIAALMAVMRELMTPKLVSMAMPASPVGDTFRR